MRKGIIIFAVLLLLAVPARALEATAPAPPDTAQRYMPQEQASLGQDLWYVIKTAVQDLQPAVAEAAAVCLQVVLITLLMSIVQNYGESVHRIADLAGIVAVSMVLIQPVNTLIRMGTETISQISEYGKLLLPVMTAAMAAQGGTASSAALYAGTAFVDTLLSAAITDLLVPMLYVYLCVCIAYCAIGEGILNNFRQGLKWLMTWGLKLVLYVFTGYMGITGVVSGTTDAAALKAAKLTISGAVPVVGGILSDASEAVLVSAGLVKNSAGIYGLVAVAAIAVGPFLQIGVQYLMLKLTSGICSSISKGHIPELIKDFSGAMGIILAMTGTVCLLLVISLVCYMRGVS